MPPCGARQTMRQVVRRLWHFNPRAPRGARLMSIIPIRWQRYFNPRAPRGARHLMVGDVFSSMIFQSTRPARGATVSDRGKEEQLRIFQSTRPARGATFSSRRSTAQRFYFNPRAPRGARHDFGFVGQSRNVISIHAPREGRDLPICAQRQKVRIFQSTRPARGATRRRRATRATQCNFNPRAPRGARPKEVRRWL